LLFEGPVIEVIITAISALVGLFGFTITWEGYLLRKMNIGERAIIVLATVFLFWPDNLIKVLGFIILASIYLFQRVSIKRQAQRVPSQ